MPGNDPRGGGVTPPEQLIRMHRRSLVHVLVLHGTTAGRDQVARVFHRESPVRSGPFVKLDAARDADALHAALEACVARDEEVGVVRESHRGTLYVDFVGRLPLETQRLLLEFSKRSTSDLPGARAAAWGGRIVAGSPNDLAPAVAQGRFIAELHDTLNKILVDLGQEGAP
ncbi:MAG: sigma 54-interacting transcriptional regulator [Candidatus Eisenbacteria bacterium]|nr:sigma 54-interacting transcriptional regulator [Candidatus Eisenbacteria bacterium]